MLNAIANEVILFVCGVRPIGNGSEHSVNIVFWTWKDVAEVTAVENVRNEFHLLPLDTDIGIITQFSMRKKYCLA